MLRHMEVIVHPANTNQLRNTSQHQTDIYLHGSTSNDGTNDSEDRLGLAKVVVFICVLLIFSHDSRGFITYMDLILRQTHD